MAARSKTPAEIVEEQKMEAMLKAQTLMKADLTMQFLFKIIIPSGIMLLNFSLFLITVLNPSVLQIVAVSIFFLLSIAFVYAIRGKNGSIN